MKIEDVIIGRRVKVVHTSTIWKDMTGEIVSQLVGRDTVYVIYDKTPYGEVNEKYLTQVGVIELIRENPNEMNKRFLLARQKKENSQIDLGD